ncbi:MAG: nucleoid-associated protein YgaU [Saprospiraceae bacterium]|jgi:nucleoid-associated protein YgaU|tara:strand:+ start:146 stop:646 length:501 start_codon:yes stop_codon:yes gene_type:complete
MGLFSFVKNAGTKLFGGKKKKVEEKIDNDNSANEAMSTALKAAISSLGLKVEALNIRVDGDAVTVSGITASNEVREKVILAIGNVEGISSVDDQIDVMPSDEGTPRGVEDTRFYTVEKGDTLWKVAQDHYGNGAKYQFIFESNKPMLAHPDKIYPGQVLRIPSLQA